MKLGPVIRNIPTRLATGAFILHSGLEKWKGSKEQAEGIHGMATGVYPALACIPPERFLRLLAVGEIMTGSLLLAPWISNAKAGLALTVFSGALLGVYGGTPGMRKPGTIWPEQAGIGFSKDAWMFGIGLGLLADARPHSKTEVRRHSKDEE